MVLPCSTCEPPILCPNFLRTYAIQISSSSKISIPKTFYSENRRVVISAPDKIINPFIEKAKCRSNLNSSGELEKGTPSSVIIFIKGLAQSTSNGVLEKAFSQFGEVSRVKVICEKKTKQSLGFAYVWFTREEHAQAAVDAMNGQFFEGRFIRVAIAMPGSCEPTTKPKSYKL